MPETSNAEENVDEPVPYEPDGPTTNPETPQNPGTPQNPQDPNNPGGNTGCNGPCDGIKVCGINPNWTDSGRDIEANTTLTVTKSGSVDFGSSNSPQNPHFAAPAVCTGFNLAIAIAPPGTTPLLNGSVGGQTGVQYLHWAPNIVNTNEEQVFTSIVSGRIYLAFNDFYDTYTDNSGYYCVHLSICARPAIPTGLTTQVLANADCSISIVLSWDETVDTTGYIVTRNGIAYPMQPGTSATFPGTVSQAETFTVRAVNGCGESNESAPATLIPEMPEIPAPMVTLCQSCCRERVRVMASAITNATSYAVERKNLVFSGDGMFLG
ncbi:MAG: hypothetical protein EON58_20755, partial [Alphaproteobacteria bacterium]